MQVIGYSKFGPASDVLTLQEVETPAPAAGEVLVQVHMSGVNPSDVKARAGARPGVTEPPFPLVVPHSDGAGIVVAVGAGVDTGRIGERVWIWNGQWQRAYGTCASHICLPAAQAVPMPDGVSFEAGAQLGIPGLTAAHAVFAGGDVAGKTVLISGAAGTVGLLATQIAVWAGARVVATARGSGLQRAKDAGAAQVVDFTAGALPADILNAAGGPIDHVIEVEFGQNADTISEVIAENGTICAFGSAQNMRPEIPFYPLMFKAVTLHMALIYILPDPQRKAAIQRLHHVLREGALQLPVAEIFDLSNAAAAHQAVEAGGREGGILVRCA